MKKKLTGLLVILNFLVLAPVLATSYVGEIARQYVMLSLSLGEYESGYIDAYYGPEEWQKQAKEKKMPLKNIIIAAKSLQDVLIKEKSKDPLVKLRILYLKGQLNALVSKALMINGSINYDFDQEAKALYDTQPPHQELSSFQPILDELNRLVPGKKPLAKRIEEFQKQFIIPKEKVDVVFRAAIRACRERTKPFVNLLKNENFKLEYVTDKPWSGYNWYQGDSFSLIQVNTDLPIYIDRAVDLGCHEGYPGHHTYNGLLEANLVKKRGWVEFSVYPLFSPQSLIAEGSADFGIEMAFPGKERLVFERDTLYPLAGIKPELAELYVKVATLKEKLSYAGNEIARLYMNKKIDADKAAEMLHQYSLLSTDKSKQRVSFFDTYGAYIINYNWGRDLVKQWVHAGPDQTKAGRWKRFGQLLSSPRLPSSLN